MRIPAWPVVVAIAIANCTTDPIRPQLEDSGNLRVRPAWLRVHVGDHTPIEAVAFDADGLPVFTGEVMWVSLDPDIVSVDDNGLVSAEAPGWGRVVARTANGQHADTATIAVGLDLTSIAMGYDQGCGWNAEGEAYCWGNENAAREGVLGRGAPPVSYTPESIAGGLKFSKIVLSDRHTCGISEGIVYCWGAFEHRTLGTTYCAPSNSANSGCHMPEPVALPPGTFTHLATSGRGSAIGAATCASGAGGVYCWGDGLAVCSSDEGCRPWLVSAALKGPVSVGAEHACALNAAGMAYCWGDNSHGQLGGPVPAEYCATEACTAASQPVPVNTTVSFTDLAGGERFTCGLTTDRLVMCWGDYGSGDPGPTPTVVSGLEFSSIAANNRHICALTEAGAAYCWGMKFDGYLQYADPRKPTRVAEGMTFSAIGVAQTTICGVSGDRGVFCIGNGWSTGQGVSHPTSVPLPLAPPGPYPDFLALDS